MEVKNRMIKTDEKPQKYHFPEAQVTVEANSLEEAMKKVKEIKKAKK